MRRHQCNLSGLSGAVTPAEARDHSHGISTEMASSPALIAHGAAADGGAAEAPLAEAPLAEAPLVEAPLAEAPLAEAPLAEAPLATAARLSSTKPS